MRLFVRARRLIERAKLTYRRSRQALITMLMCVMMPASALPAGEPRPTCMFRAYAPAARCWCVDDYVSKPPPFVAGQCPKYCDNYVSKPPPAVAPVPCGKCPDYVPKGGCIWLFKAESWYRCVSQRGQ